MEFVLNICFKMNNGGLSMKKYVKSFVIAFVVCELVQLAYNYFRQDRMMIILVGVITSVLIAIIISFGLNFFDWKKILKKEKK